MTDRLTYTAAETGAILGISTRLVYDLVARQELRAVHLGRRILIPRIAVDELLAAS